MEVITWNTGAGYTEHGQRFIAAKVEGRIYFRDIDRGLGGSFESDEKMTRAMVMNRYDGKYIGNGQTRYGYASMPHDAQDLLGTAFFHWQGKELSHINRTVNELTRVHGHGWRDKVGEDYAAQVDKSLAWVNS